jgi:perosamine synthetase
VSHPAPDHVAARIPLTVPGTGPEDAEAVAEVLRSGMLVQGERVAAFEAALARVAGTRHAVAVSSGTAALLLSLMALGIGPGDEVIVPDFTFPATANVVEQVGATPVPVDIDLATFNVRPEAVTPAITDRTRAVMPVDLFGLAAPWGRLEPLLKSSGLAAVEDSACAIGASIEGRPCGSFGRLAAFSFHPRKVVTTGEGGAVTTDDDELAEQVRLLRNHGMTRGKDGVEFVARGLNFRLGEMAAAVGLVQLSRLDEYIEARRHLARAYEAALTGAPVRLPREPTFAVHTYQAYVVVLPDGSDRAAIIRALAARGIESAVGTYAVHALPFYARKYDLRDEQFPDATAAHRRSLALPLFPGMTQTQLEETSSALKDLLAA